MQTQFRRVNTQGQISIGKKFVGKNIKIEEYADGSVVLTPVEIISTFEFNLMKDQMFQKRLAEFGEWESDNQPQKTNVDKLIK